MKTPKKVLGETPYITAENFNRVMEWRTKAIRRKKMRESGFMIAATAAIIALLIVTTYRIITVDNRIERLENKHNTEMSNIIRETVHYGLPPIKSMIITNYWTNK